MIVLWSEDDGRLYPYTPGDDIAGYIKYYIEPGATLLGEDFFAESFLEALLAKGQARREA